MKYSAVTPIAPHFPNTRSRPPSNDERRNLYVLGLPFALTKYVYSSYRPVDFQIPEGTNSLHYFLDMELFLIA
jgi:hypothetical protein